MVDSINYAVISQAREFVWSIDETQIDNVRIYLGTAPSKPLLSPAQREKVMQAARTGRENT
ncbi:hypothetical protein ACVWYH_004834 [Bradyrhizobium sp. GM24.11]